MNTEGSRTAKIRDEMVGALSHWAKLTGGKHTDAATLGAWLFIGLPELLQQRLRKAYYRWCESQSLDCYIPPGVDRLLDAVAGAIDAQVAAEKERIERERGKPITLSEMADDPPSPAEAEAAARRALAAEGGGRSVARQGKGRERGTRRKSG